MHVAVLKIKRKFRYFTEEISLKHNNLQNIFDDKYGKGSFQEYEFLSVNLDSEYFYYFFKLKIL